MQLGLGPHPRRAVAGLAGRVGVGDVPAGARHCVGELLRQPPAAGDQHELGRVERIGEVARAAGRARRRVKRPTSRATTIRRSVRNGIVWAASTTERSSYSSPSNSSTSRLRSSSPTRWATRSCALERRIDSSSPVRRWTLMAAPILTGDRRRPHVTSTPTVPSTTSHPTQLADPPGSRRAPSIATRSTHRTPSRHGSITTGATAGTAPASSPAGRPYSITPPATGAASRLAGHADQRDVHRTRARPERARPTCAPSVIADRRRQQAEHAQPIGEPRADAW